VPGGGSVHLHSGGHGDGPDVRLRLMPSWQTALLRQGHRTDGRVLVCFHDNGPGLPRDMGNPNLPRDQRDDDPAHIFFGVSGNHKSVHDPEEPSLNVDNLADGGGTRYCIEYCARLGGYKYAGLQWVDECWCGESTRYLAVALPSPLSSRRAHQQAMSMGILVPLTSKRK
jgi:hypothetical protein